MYQSSNTLSLASLPTEVITAIEANITHDSLSESLRGLPKNECMCEHLREGFMEQDDYEEAFENFKYEHDIEEDPDARNYCEILNEFEETDEWHALWRKYEEEHAARPDECFGMKAGDRWWGEASNYLRCGGWDIDTDGFDLYKQGRVEAFLEDHGLQVWELDDGLQAHDCVTLVFRNTIVSRTGDKIREEVPFFYNKQQVLQKRARIGLLPPEGQGVVSEGQQSIRWVKKLDDECSESNPYCISSGEESDTNDDIISISSDD